MVAVTVAALDATLRIQAGELRELGGEMLPVGVAFLRLRFEAAELGTQLKWEPSRGGALFPHLYGRLPTRLATWVKPLPLGADGRHVFPEFS